MKILMEKRQMVLYMLFGTVTAATNVGVYYLMSKINDNTAVDTAVALFAAIVVAYATNRKMVFHSTHHGMRKVALEFISFMACRLISGMLDIIIMVVFVDFLHHNV